MTRPLGQEITTGQQTFIQIDGALYLKINPADPTVRWYTALQKDVDLALHPPPPPPPPVQAKKVCQYQKVEKTNGSLVFVVDVPDFVKDNVQKKGNVTKKKKK
uniref:Uncharacterized protein n=1 Tax=Arcella intermedia TaxID=1963864 RepID=A0A6B2LN10_9EUKA